MEITQTVLNDIFKSFSAKFNEAYSGASAEQLAALNILQVEDFAMMLQVTGSATDHAWLTQLGKMRKWIGDRVINALEMGRLLVTNESYENTVGVKRTAIEDDTFGLFANNIANMGAEARELWMTLAMGALLANGSWADANPFFCKGRKLKADATSVITNGTTDAFSADALDAARVTMQSYILEGKRPAKVAPFLLIVGPSNQTLAAEILKGEIVPNSAGTASKSNPLKNMVPFKVSLDLVGDNAGKWYLCGQTGTVRGTAVQQRKQPVLTRMDSETDTNVFMRDEYLYGTDARGEGFLTLPFLTYAGGLATVADWVDPDA